HLRLGSSRSASGTPAADHFMPAGAGLGASVPLVTPAGQASPRGEAPTQTQPGQLPSGKLYLFWGCGERAGPGQPVVIDFSKLAQGQVPPNLFAASVALPSDWRVGPDNSATF